MSFNIRHITTKCSGVNCPIKEHCGRFDGMIHERVLTPPFSVNNGVFSCSMFMGDNQKTILNTLLKATGHKPDAYCDDYCSKSGDCDKTECNL